ncbi:MAG: hypothetical protein KDD42_04850, partial [Bdellovibrionales bacterium]|nr:hypothetical protein [Bdellovibrionales bacterium]
ATRFPCSDDGPSCLRIELNSDSSSSQAAVTFNLPFLLLSSEPIEISSTATVRSQATYLPSDSMIVINQTDGSDDD